MASLGNLAVGAVVKLNVNGAAKNFIVLHHGTPSSMYDSSCTGTWLMMENIHALMAWDGSDNSYKASDVHTYLNGTFIGLLDSAVQSSLKQVKIPYQNGTGGSGAVSSGSSGISTKVFLLSGYELGWSTNTSTSFPKDGACLDYFNGTAEVDSKRIGYYNGTETRWWMRSPVIGNNTSVWYVNPRGDCGYNSYSNAYGVRPVFILPKTFEVDDGPGKTTPGYVNIGGVQKKMTGDGYVNVGGVLRKITGAKVNADGVVKELYLGG